MADDVEKLILSISAETRQINNALRRLEGDAGRSTRTVERNFERMGKQIETNVRGAIARANQSVTSFGAGLARGAGGALLAGFSIQGVQRYVDTATRIQNALKVAGLEGDNLSKVYDRLFASAQKNAAPLETMVTLYSRIAQAQDSLGVSQEQIINFTDKIGVALRVAGTSAQEASGALLQLGQALGAGTVRAEEFNSINEGARPILQAVAAGLKEAGGSVAELRKLVLDGKVSSEAFFRAFEAGASTLEDRVKSAQLTIGDGFTRLQNVLIDTADRFNRATDASGRTAEGLARLAEIIEGIGSVFEAAANGPVGAFIGKLEQLNTLLKSIEPVSRSLGILTDPGTLGGLSGALGGTPAETGLSAQIAAKQAELAQLQEDSTSAYDFASREKIKDLQAEIAELQQDLRNAKDKEQLFTPGAGPSGPVRNPVSLNDYPVGGSASGGATGGGTAASMIRGFEGFRERAYWDVNAWRVGFGSDTATRANGIIEKVTQDTIVTLEDAERDLSRRLVEFQTGIQNAIGIEKWKSLSEAQQAALTSIAYNYGSIGPGGADIADIVRTGSQQQVANAIASLSANPDRRRQEAAAFGGASLPTVEAVQQATDAWAGLRDQTQQTAAATLQVSEGYSTLETVGVTALQGLKNALADGKVTAEEMLGIVIDIVQQLIQARSAAGGIGGGGFGAMLGGGGLLGGAIIPGILHKGGVAGQDGYGHGRMVSPSVFAGAHRYHKGGVAGLQPGEVPAILQRGEVVLPRMPRATTGGAQNVHVTVGVSADNNGNLKPFVESVARTEASASTRAGIGSYDKQLPGRVTEVMERQGRG